MPEFVSNFIQVHMAAYDDEIQDYKFLVLQRASGLKVYPNIWQVITGTIEKGETALQTALREISEEIELIPNKIWTLPYLTTFFNAKKDTINASPVFAVLVDYVKTINISDEHQNYKWLNFQDCIDCLELPSHKQGTKIFLDYILNNKDNSKFEL